jgi:hypothetical protein
MMDSVVESPRRFWGVLREMRGAGGGSSIPGQMKEHVDDELSGDEKDINAMWVRAYHRKTFVNKTPEGKKWVDSLRRFVIKKEAWVREQGQTQQNVRIGIKGFCKAVGAMKKDGSPGTDLISARMINEAGEAFKQMIASMMEDWANKGLLPDQFRIEIVVPLFKRMCKYIPKCYRPVSLVQVGLKAMQTVLYDEVNTTCGKRLTGEYNFGSVKKRDRHMAIWLTNLVCIYEQKKCKHEGMLIMWAWDAENAFPSLMQDGADFLMWKNGVRGMLWVTLRNMEKRLQGRIRINGNWVHMPQHEDGASQGAVSPPHRWKYVMAQWFRRRQAQKQGRGKNKRGPKGGVELGKETIPGVGFVDDITMNAYGVSDSVELMRDREVFGERWGVQWKKSKDSCMIRGNRKGMKGLKQEMQKAGFDPQPVTKLLGEWMGHNPSRCPKQVQEVIKMMRKSAHGLEWMMWRGTAADARMVEGMFGTMVLSIAKSHLVHTYLTVSEWEQVEGVKAGVGKKFLRLSRRASRRGVLYELGWSTVQGWVWRERLGFYARLKASEGMMEHAFDVGVELANEGKADGTDTGMLGNVRKILGELGLMAYWGRGASPGKTQWKKIVKQAVGEWESRCRTEWKIRKGMSAQWGMAMVCSDEESPLLRLTGEDRTLLAGVRLMITREEMETHGRIAQECGVCGEAGQQGIMHLVTGCRFTMTARKYALGEHYEMTTNRQKWGALTTGGDRNMLYLNEVARVYKRQTEQNLMPWVGCLGTRHKEGLVGMSVLVQQVAEWVDNGRN